MQNPGFVFSELPSVRLLGELAEKPFDLAAPGALSAPRIEGYSCGAAGFTLLYSTQRVDDRVLAALQQLADQAGLVDQFLAMQRGAVINRIEGFASENRPVLHTSCRDLFRDDPACPESVQLARQELAKLDAFLDDLDSGRLVNGKGEPFTDLVHVGIGGSDLGPRAVYLALAAFRRPDRRVHFLSNVDPDDGAAVLRGLDLSRTLVNVVSKSGSTLETLTNEEFVRKAFQRLGLAPERHFLAVTGKGSPMDNPARYLRSFFMYDAIGGRYSVSSMVGAVVLGFGLGRDVILDFLQGAAAMDRAAEERDILQNPALLLALLGIWNRNFLGHHSLAVLPYSQALLRFPAHLQQCDMESNGKSVSRRGRLVSHHTGPIVWGEPGTNGQHAFYQLLHQGTTVVPVEFIGFRQSQYGEDIMVQATTSQQKLVANLLAQAQALAAGQENDNPNRRFPGNRPSSILLADRLTPHAMGALLALYEAKIVFQGFAWGINSFDQEGVQLGKVLANRLLESMALGEGARAGQTDGVDLALLRAAGCLLPDQ